MGISDSLAHVAVYYMALGDPMFMCLPHYTRHPVLLRAAILVRLPFLPNMFQVSPSSEG